ncbi:MAG: FAD-dependent oxidoreductase [Actinomycetota bacterium]|nr:FAD-dependent oxidoreductase [Actinomycetota bacterium]
MANVSRETFKNIYDVIIIGAGLCGSEAAALIAKYNLRILIINISMDNPGYIKYENLISDDGSGHLNKINILEKYFLKNIKKTTILQKKIKNDFKEEFVIDRKRFSLNIKYFLECQANIDTRQGLVQEIELREKESYRITLNDGERFEARYILISCGTFFNGITVFGENRIKSGRHGEISSISLCENLKKHGIKFERKKTYIPACVDGKNICTNEKIIDKKYISVKKASDTRFVLNTYSEKFKNNNVFSLINKDLEIDEETPIGIKIYKLYPESNETREYNISNFISAESEPFQEERINKIYSLENAILTRPSYLIEYDGIKNSEINDLCESKKLKNIYFPGEINGTYNYLEIAYQGILSAADIVNKFNKKKVININKYQ